VTEGRPAPGSAAPQCRRHSLGVQQQRRPRSAGEEEQRETTSSKAAPNEDLRARERREASSRGRRVKTPPANGSGFSCTSQR
jgi:hypothetical protein